MHRNDKAVGGSNDPSALSNEQLNHAIASASEFLAAAKADQNRRNATSDLERTMAKWRAQTGVDPLAAYETFAAALASQRKKGVKQSKKWARAIAIMLQRPELFAHYADTHLAVDRYLRARLDWHDDGLPEQLADWVGQRGKRRAEEEFEQADNKLRELTQRPEQATLCLRPYLQELQGNHSQ